MASFALPAPGLTPTDLIIAGQVGKPTATASKGKARAAAQDFEAVFINSMLQQMYTGIDGEGPFGGNGATGVWRSFLTQTTPSRSRNRAASASRTRSIKRCSRSRRSPNEHPPQNAIANPARPKRRSPT